MVSIAKNGHNSFAEVSHVGSMFVYILASKSPVLYVGVTADLLRRLWKHRAERWLGDVSSGDPSHPLGVTRTAAFDYLDEFITMHNNAI